MKKPLYIEPATCAAAVSAGVVLRSATPRRRAANPHRVQPLVCCSRSPTAIGLYWINSTIAGDETPVLTDSSAWVARLAGGQRSQLSGLAHATQTAPTMFHSHLRVGRRPPIATSPSMTASPSADAPGLSGAYSFRQPRAAPACQFRAIGSDPSVRYGSGGV